MTASVADFEDLNQDPLACAARDGDVEEVLRLLDGGCNPNVGQRLRIY